MLALLLGAFSLFAPAPAQAQNTPVWSATLTVKVATGFRGCMVARPCATNLTDADFTYGTPSATYAFKSLFENHLSGANKLQVWIDGLTGAAAKTALTGLTLNVGSTSPDTYAIADATVDGDYLTWSRTPSWNLNDAVSVSLTSGPSAPSAPTNLVVGPGNGSLSLSWTAPSGTITGYDVHYTSAPATGSGSVANSVTTTGSNPATAWVAVTHSGTTASQTISSLTNNTAYRVRVRAKNSVGNGAWVFGTGTPTTSTVSLSVSPNPVAEGSPVMVTATLSAALSSPVTIPVTVSISGSNTAESGDVGMLTSISISSGQTTGTGTISTIQDADGDDETFTVSLGSSLPSSVTAGSPNSVQVTIREVVDGTPCSGTQLGQLRRKFGDFRFGSNNSNVVNEGGSVTVEARLREMLDPPCEFSIPLTAREPGLYQGRRAPTAAELAEDIELPLDPIVIRAGQTTGSSTIRTKRDADHDDELFYVVLDEGTLGVEVGGQHNDLGVEIRDGEYRPPTSRNPPADPPPDPDTEETDTGGSTPGGTPGGGGGGGGSGGGGGAPPTGGDSPLPEEPQDPEQTDDCGDNDRENLVSFYEATDGENWDDNTDWNSEEPLGQWFGVDTDEDGEVLSLRLEENNLSGQMPTEELLCLNEDTELKELALWDNDGLSGKVPDELALAVERAVLRDVAVALNLNPGWFEDYEDPFNFSDWHGGVTTDDDGRVTELDFTGEGITGEIPQSVFVLEKLTAIITGCKVTVDPVPERVRVTIPEGCSDASLQNIEISPGELEFDPMDFSYEVAVGYGPESVTVTPTASESEAVITVNGKDAVSGEDVEIELNEEEPTIVRIVVTAPDGMTTRTYGITVTRCGEDDMWALSRFYEAVGGQNWNDNTNWNSQEPLDRWFGVGTDEDGRVISLDLEGNGLSGETPRELVCLSEIKELALWDNDSLSGKEPEELALAVERAVLRDVAEALSLNTEWFDDYGEPFDFEDWYEGVTTDDDGRVTELDFTREEITGEIPGSVFELKRLILIETGCGVTLEVEAPERVSVVPDDCPEETPPEDMEEMEEEEEETAASGGGGCALGQGDSSLPGFGLFLVTLLVFAALGRRRAQG